MNNPTDSDWRIQLVNTSGQTVFQQKGQYSQTVNIDAKGLQSGIYIGDYQSVGKRKTQKVVVQH